MKGPFSTGTKIFLSLGFISELFYLSLYLIPDYHRSVAGIVPFAVNFFIYLFLLFRLLKGRPKEKVLFVVLIFSFIFQLTLLPGTPVLDDDIYRYIWDGRTMAHGINPYAYPPGDPALYNLRDEFVFPKINYNYINTIYPPLAEVFFFLAYRLWPDSVVGMKFFILLLNAAVIYLILRILERCGKDKTLVYIYCWNPLMLKEVANSGHMEPLALLFLLASIYLVMDGRTLLSAAVYALSVLSKLFPLVLLPFYLKRTGARGGLLMAFVAGTVYLPFLVSAPVEAFSGLGAYWEHWVFNPGLFDVVRLVVSPFLSGDTFVPAKWVCMFLLLLVIIYLCIKDDGTHKSLIKSLFFTLAALIILSPVIDPWYLLWVLPLLCIRVDIPWLVFTGLAFLSYLFYLNDRDIVVVRLMEHGLFAVLLVLAVARVPGLSGLGFQKGGAGILSARARGAEGPAAPEC